MTWNDGILGREIIEINFAIRESNLREFIGRRGATHISYGNHNFDKNQHINNVPCNDLTQCNNSIKLFSFNGTLKKRSREINIGILMKKQMGNSSHIRRTFLFISTKRKNILQKQPVIIETTGVPMKGVIVFLFSPIEHCF